MKRRTFLRGLGGAALAAPFLSSLWRSAGAQEVEAPLRLVIFYTGNGVQMERWFPTIEDGALNASHFQGTSLEVLGSHAPKLLFPRGLAMTPRGFNLPEPAPPFDPHDQGMGSKLTAARLSAEGSYYPLGHSIDFEAAWRVNKSGDNPLVLYIGRGGGFGGVKLYTSYSAPETPYAGETNPLNIYRSLTGMFSDDAAREYLVRQRQSIIDLVADDLETFKRLPMSSADKRKVEDWLSLIRETENRVIPASCTPDLPGRLGLSETEMQSFGSRGGANSDEVRFKAGGDMMLRLAVLAMVCDANRVITIQWQGLGGPTFTWDGMDHRYTHHQLSHRTGSDAAGGSEFLPGVEDMIAQIDRWYAGRYKTLLDLLDNLSEGEGTLLDNSAVVWLNELADGQRHNNENLPTIIAGSLGGYLRTGASVNLGIPTGGRPFASGGTPLTKLYTTLLNGLGAREDGAPIESFGDLEFGQPGEIAEIKA